MKEIIDRLQEQRNIELAKSILESKGYRVSKRNVKESRRLKEGVGASWSDWEKPPYGYHEDKVKYYTDPDTDNVGMLLSSDENGNYSVLILDGDGEELGGTGYDAVADNLTDLKDAERCAVKLFYHYKHYRSKYNQYESKYVANLSQARVNEAEEGAPTFYCIAIDGSTNAPGSTYTSGERGKVGEKILKLAGISSPDIEAMNLGYDDISFIIKSNDKKYVDKIARKISAYAEEPSDAYRAEYDMPRDAVVSVSGPYHDEYLEDYDDNDLKFWYR